MAYGSLYKLGYRDYLGRHTTIYVLKDGYTGAETEVVGMGDPLFIEARTDSEYMFDQIMASFADLILESELPFQFIDIFNANKYKHRIDVYKERVIGETEELFWRGYCLPDSYSEPLDYERGYPVTLSARDGLGDLKNIDFVQDSGNRYVGKTSPIKLIAELLKKTKNELPINFSVNLVENYDTSGGRLLEGIYIDYRAFYNVKVQSCEYVLKQILQAFGCRLVQSWGEWWVERIPLFLSNHTVYKYDSNGIYLSSIIRNPISLYTGKNDTTLNALFFADKQGQMYINPAFKGFVINQDYGKLKSILTNYDFEDTGNWIFPTTENGLGSVKQVFNIPGWDIYDNYTPLSNEIYPTYLAAADSICMFFWPNNEDQNWQSSIKSTGKLIRLNTNKKIRLKFTLYTFSNFLFFSTEVKFNNQWLKADGTVSNTVQFDSVSSQDSNIQPPQSQEVTYIYSYPTDVESNLYVRFANGFNGQYSGFVYIDNVKVDFVDEFGTEYPENVSYNVTIDENNNETPEDVDSIVGDLPEISDNEDIYVGGFWRLEAGEFIPTKSWSVQGDTRALSLMGILAETISDQHIKPKQKISGALVGNFDFAKALKIPFMTNKLYIPIRLSLSDKYCKFEGDFIELLPYTAIEGARVLGTGAGELIQTGSGKFIKV